MLKAFLVTSWCLKPTFLYLILCEYIKFNYLDENYLSKLKYEEY